MELWPQQAITLRNRVRKEDDPDMVKERDSNPDRRMNLSRNVFFQPTEGECKVPTRYVVSPTTQLNIEATWFTLVTEDGDAVDYLVLSESDMDSVERYIDEQSDEQN